VLHSTVSDTWSVQHASALTTHGEMIATR